MTLVSNKASVFLSHSGLDARRATALAARLERELCELGYDVEVFNTSEPEHRYQELRELLVAGDDWRARAKEYDESLRAYIEENLRKASAFVAFVTPNSLRAASEVIRYEVELARSVARENRRPFFFPCVADGARLRDLPEGAVEFQGIELFGDDDKGHLAEAVRRALSDDDATRGSD